MTGLVRALERFLLPNACVVCDRAVEPQRPDGLVCGLCRARLHPIGPGCERCGQPRPPVGPCRFCAGWPAVLSWVRSAVWLDDTARPLVHHLKYDGLPTLGGDLAELMARRIARPPPGYLVPIPLSAKRLRQRGYNQAAALARALAGRWRFPVAERLLSRARDTGTQTALTPEARARNVAGAFTGAPSGIRIPEHPGLAPGVRSARSAVPGGAGGDGAAAGEAPGAGIILVDDVLTTGATLVAAATALGAAGWPTVGAVTFARALPYELRAAG
jgi:predicted amidophosphoribosyltransferase